MPGLSCRSIIEALALGKLAAFLRTRPSQDIGVARTVNDVAQHEGKRLMVAFATVGSNIPAVVLSESAAHRFPYGVGKPHDVTP
jgi:hypothetical protein